MANRFSRYFWWLTSYPSDLRSNVSLFLFLKWRANTVTILVFVLESTLRGNVLCDHIKIHHVSPIYANFRLSFQSYTILVPYPHFARGLQVKCRCLHGAVSSIVPTPWISVLLPRFASRHVCILVREKAIPPPFTMTSLNITQSRQS